LPLFNFKILNFIKQNSLMEIDNSKNQDNITENILKDEGNPNKEPSTQPIEIVDETSHLDNSQEAPELEMREEVNASPIQGDSDLQVICK